MLVVNGVAVGPFAENTYLVGDSESREAILVDPGGQVAQALQVLEASTFKVTRIFITHGHIDHVAGAAEAIALLGAGCQIHRLDAPFLQGIPQQAAMFGLPDVAEIPKVDRLHDDGDTLTVGDQVGRIIHTPGHSPGSCCLYFEGAKSIFVGDLLFAGSVGRTDLPAGSFKDLAHSIREKVFPLGDDVTFFPGHGPEGTLGDERRNNPFVGDRARLGG